MLDEDAILRAELSILPAPVLVRLQQDKWLPRHEHSRRGVVGRTIREMSFVITDPAANDVNDEIAKLSTALDNVIPKKQARNLLVGTWNIRAFDRATPQWRTAAGDSPIRDPSNVLCMAEIVRRFDVVAVEDPADFFPNWAAG